MSWTFSRDDIRAFRFVRCDFDAQTGVARLVYAFDDGPELTETITLPGAPFKLEGARAAAAQRALRLPRLRWVCRNMRWSPSAAARIRWSPSKRCATRASTRR